MGFEHNRLAYGANKLLLSQLQSNRAPWATPRLTASTTYWQGIADYPRPDGAFEDKTTDSSLAIEFKPPGQIKREYVTGFGQVLTYLRTFEYAAMIIPARAGDGFAIAEYLRDTLNEPFASTLPLGLFSYERDPSDPADLTPLVNLRPRQGAAPGIPRGIGRSVFWGYWRDLSQYDVLSLLIEVDSQTPPSFDSAYESFWLKYLTTGTAQTWEGTNRRPKQPNAPGYGAERLNAYYSLRHSGFINSDGSLTEAGHHLLRLGKIYGADSVAFKKYMGSQILDVGRHLELIFWVEEQQRRIRGVDKSTAAQFNRLLDEALYAAGVIPSITQGAKAGFLRDEPKLWNKLGLLVPSTGNTYFHPHTGYVFNWRAILAMTGN